MAKIIHIGTCEPILATRKAVMEKAGHAVTLAHDLRAVIAACNSETFDIGILGHTLPAMEKLRVYGTLRHRCEGIRILEFHDAVKPDLADADAHLRVSQTSQEVFIDTVNRLARALKKKRKAPEC